MARKVGCSEFREVLASWLREAGEGEVLELTRHEAVVAVITRTGIPVEAATAREQRVSRICQALREEGVPASVGRITDKTGISAGRVQRDLDTLRRMGAVYCGADFCYRLANK